MNKKSAATERSKVIRLNLGRAHEPGHQHGSGHPIVRIHVLGSMRATTYLGADILPRGKKAYVDRGATPALHVARGCLPLR
jgi:hypothetical protein